MALTPEQENAFRALEYVFDHDAAAAGGASIGGLRGLLGEDEAARAATTLKQGGLIVSDGMLSGGYHITGDGRTAVEKIRGRRIDRGYRRKACRDDLLRWVDSNTKADDPQSRVARERFDDSLDLVQYDDGEVLAAANFLNDNGFIKTISTGEADHILMWVTARGQEVVDAGGVERFLAQTAPVGTTTNYTFAGTGNTFATATAAGAVANATVNNFNLDHARLFAAAVRQAEAELVLNDDARSALAEIEESGDDTEKASRATKFLYTALMATTTGGLGQVLGMLGASALGITP